MKLVRVKAIVAKEFIHIRRDPLSLAMAFLMPVMLLFIFGYAITLDVRDLRTVVHDLDGSYMSRELVRGFSESGYFTVVETTRVESEIERSLESGRAMVAISVPEGFSRDIKRGVTPTLQVVVDGSDSNTASIALGYVSGVTERFSQRLSPVGGRGAGERKSTVDLRTRVWYNPELKSSNFIIPGLIAVIMAVIAALLTSLTIARELERGTIEQLISTPVKKAELITGKLIPYFVIGLVDVVVSVVIGVYFFAVPLEGSAVLLLALSSVFLFGGLSLGLLISIVAKTQIVASQIAMVSTFLPAFLLSGFMYAVENMPVPIRIGTYLVPARYFVTILKGIFLKGSTLGVLALETALLTAFGAVVFALTIRSFKKKVF